MPDDKYEFCGIEIVPYGESPRGTKAYAEAHKLKVMQREARPTYTATLEDMQRQFRAAMCVPDWMLEPKEEARPQDMAIWRAILAGDEWFTIGKRSGPSRKAMLWHVRRGSFLGNVHKVNGVRAYVRSSGIHLLRKVMREAPLFARQALCVHRVVLFTHPFTGGRAVFSEPVD